MVYIVTFILFIIGIFTFDFTDIKRFRKVYYYIVCLWLIFLSAVQYRMGADITAYMGEYDQYANDLSWKYLSSYTSRRPGWVLLNVLCSSVSADFVLLKSVIAIFVNFIIFRFFNKYCKYVFLCLLIFFISLYLPLNFNILRASIPIAIFLYSIDALMDKKLIKYYILVAIALLFHESALFLIVIPFLVGIKISDKNINIICLLIIVYALVLFLSPNLSKSFSHLLSLFGNNQLDERGAVYIGGDNYTNWHFSIFGFIQNLAFVIVYLFFLRVCVKRNLLSNMFRSLFLVYILIIITNGSFPILYRFGQFLLPVYAVVAANSIAYIAIRYRQKIITFAFFFVIVGYMHLNELFIIAEDGTFPIIQYYPYYTVFDKREYGPRELMWGYKENRQLY